MADLHVERLSTATHDQAVAVIVEGLTQHWGGYDDSLNPDLDDLFVAYGHGATVVALTEGQVVGTATLIPVGDSQAEIVRMSVSAAVRRQGVGRRLVDEMMRMAGLWQCDRVILETTSTWADAVGLYQACGFKVTHVEDSPFGPSMYFVRPVVAGAGEL